jgi:hypothetical protein
VSFKLCLWVGHFDATSLFPVQPVVQEEIEQVLRRYAVRDDTNQICRGRSSKDGTKSEIGFIDREWVIYRQPGFVEINIGSKSLKISAFMWDVCEQLGCTVRAPDSDEPWTEMIRAQAEEYRRLVASSTNPTDTEGQRTCHPSP